MLWAGYFVLEGFDFGVGMLTLAIGRDDLDRRLARNAIGHTDLHAQGMCSMPARAKLNETDQLS